ncbi:MAG: Phenylalanine--tRNA ligase beta subunit [Candidatus Anoxychlamydiales bacterium]|nr:Phenylalanine--tRNA ligase beta subunit [Candidatus Anoxychlamydiales bacterium]
MASSSSALSMLSINVAPEIFAKFPQTKVCFALIEVMVKSRKAIPKSQQRYLSDLKQKAAQSVFVNKIDSTNFEQVKVCESWDRVFNQMNAGNDKKSTIYYLLRRASAQMEKLKEGKKADLGSISNFVDLYNCISLQQLTPMGALDLEKIQRQICLRFGKEGETFVGLGSEGKFEPVRNTQVVYADDKSVLTWLWNYRDAAHACVPMNSPEGEPSYILLFADQAEESKDVSDPLNRPGDASAAIEAAAKEISNIGGRVLFTACLDKDTPQSTLDLGKLIKK